MMYAYFPDKAWGYVIEYGSIAAMFALVLWLAYTIHKKLERDLKGPHSRRGFEVKQPAGGESPVLREKETNHG